jgi:DNA-binding CsgD family transcriptional regulator
MSRRGRPRHPDVLTPREQDVLELLRQGLTNPQIAESLGISLDGAKYHVAEILGKLGVDSREGAAAWRPEEHRPWWALATSPFITPWRKLAGALPPAVTVAVSSAMILTVLGGSVLLAVLLSRRGGGSAVPRTIDVKQLTIEDVRARALAALSQPDMVFHTVETTRVVAGGQMYDYKREVWLDLEHNLARSAEYVDGKLQEDGGLLVYHDDHIAAVYSGRFSDAIIGPAPPPPPPTSTMALDYIGTIFTDKPKSTKLEAATVAGSPAILVDMVVPAGEGGQGTANHRIFLNEQFLPIRVETSGSGSNGMLQFQNDFQPRASLPGALFSINAVQALVKTGADRMQQALAAGFHPYWLGDPYKDLPLYDANVGAGSGGVQIFDVTYEANANGGGPEKPPYGLTMMEFSPEGYATWLQNVGQTQWWQASNVEHTIVGVTGATATVYRAPGLRPIAPSVEGSPTTTPNATPAFNLRLVVEYADAVVLIDPNIGPSNPYATVEAMTEIAQALRPFEPAP